MADTLLALVIVALIVLTVRSELVQSQLHQALRNYPFTLFVGLGLVTGWRFRAAMRDYRETSDQSELLWAFIFGFDTLALIALAVHQVWSSYGT